ncbi:MAG: MFS transporter [Rhodothermales bacterium]
MRILFLGVLVTALDIAILGPALRSIGVSFNVDERTVAWVFIIYTLFTQLGVPFTSRLSDQFGRRFAFTWSLGIFIIGLLVVVLSANFTGLLAGRSLQGIGASGILPVVSALIGDLYPVEKRGRVLGVIGAIFGISFIFGPAIGGILIQYGWQWLFLISLPLAIVVWIWAMFKLPKVRPEHARRLDLAGILSLGIALALVTVGINQIDSSQLAASIQSVSVWPFLAGSLICFLTFLGVERRVSEPFVRLSLFESRQVSIACFISVGAGMCEAVFVFLPSFAVVAFDVTDRSASFMLMPLVLALAIGSPLWGRMLDKVGARIIVVTGTLLVVMGTLTLGTLMPSIPLYYFGLACIGLGLAAILGSAISYILLNEAEQKERTVVQGIARLFKGFGRLLGGALIGAIVASSVDSIEGYTQAFFIIAILASLFHLASYGLRSKAEDIEHMNLKSAS